MLVLSRVLLFSCFACWCVPQNLGKVTVCDHGDHKHITIKDQNNQSYFNTAPDSSSATHSFNNVSATPKPGETWGSANFCDDLIISCN